MPTFKKAVSSGNFELLKRVSVPLYPVLKAVSLSPKVTKSPKTQHIHIYTHIHKCSRRCLGSTCPKAILILIFSSAREYECKYLVYGSNM